MEVVDLQARPRVPLHSAASEPSDPEQVRHPLCPGRWRIYAPGRCGGSWRRHACLGARPACRFQLVFLSAVPHAEAGRAFTTGEGERRPRKETGPGPGCTQRGAPSLPPAVSAGGTGRGWEGLLVPPSPDLGLTREVGPSVAPASSARYENRTRMSVKCRRPEHV